MSSDNKATFTVAVATPQPLTKRVEVAADCTAAVDVSIAVFSLEELVNDLVRREALNPDEGQALIDGKAMSDFYGEDCDCDDEAGTPDGFDDAAYQAAEDAIGRRDVPEALEQASRVMPGLRDLAYVVERQASAAGRA